MRAAKKQSAAKLKTGPAPPSRWRSHDLSNCVVLCFAALLAFANSFSAGFAFDNRLALLDDPRIRQATPQNLALIFQHTYWWPYGEAGLYRPLTTLSYLFNYGILGNGQSPVGYHWFNFLFHALNVVLLYFLGKRLFQSDWPALFLSAAWAVHPLLTESVTNIVGRADLLAGAAVLGGFLIYLKSTESSGRARGGWLAALALTGLAGFFSKESAVILLGVIVLYEAVWWKKGKSIREPLLGIAVLLPPLAVMLYQRSLVLSAAGRADFPFTDNPITGAGFWTAKLTALEVLARYLWLSVWPAKLSADYSYNQIPLTTGTIGDWMAWLTIAAAAVATVWLLRVQRTAFFFAAFAFLALFPTSNLLFPLGTIMAERFMYLPLIGVLGCAVLGLYALGEHLRNPKLAPTVLAAAAVLFAVRTWARNADWHDAVSLATATVRSAPDSFKAHKLLAVALDESDAADTQLDREISEARQSIAIIDSLPPAQSDPAIYRLASTLYGRKGDSLRKPDSAGRPVNTPESTALYEAALSTIERSITILQAVRRRTGFTDPVPDFVTAENGRLLASIYQRLGDTGKSLDLARQAQQMEPLNPDMYRQLAASYFAAGSKDDAEKTLMEGMLVTQDMEIRSQLIGVYGNQGCALMQGPNGPAINPSCETVHAHMCAIAADAIQIRLRTGRRDIAEELKRSFLNDYHCPAGPIDQVLP